MTTMAELRRMETEREMEELDEVVSEGGRGEWMMERDTDRNVCATRRSECAAASGPTQTGMSMPPG